MKALRIEAAPIAYRFDWYISQRLWFAAETVPLKPDWSAPYVEPRFSAWNILASDSIQKLGLAIVADINTRASEFHEANYPRVPDSVPYILAVGRFVNAIADGQLAAPPDATRYAKALANIFKAEGRYRPLPLGSV